MRAGLAFSCLAGSACSGGGGEPRERSEPEAVRSTGSELTMREPDARDQPGELGALQPVAVSLTAEPTAAPVATTAPSAPSPLRVAKDPPPQPYALRERDLVLPGGLAIHDVPAGVTVRRVDALETKNSIYELVDARGRRVALIEETALSKVALPGGPPLLQATAASSARAKREWNDKPVDVTTDRFQNDTHLYTLERRSAGTDWIVAGLELGR